MRRLNLSEDYRLGSLSRVVEAVTLTYEMESRTKARLKAHVKAIRLYVEAGEREEARRLVTELRAASVGEDWTHVIRKHCDRLEKLWNWEEKKR